MARSSHSSRRAEPAGGRSAGRANQKLRTRKSLLEAAARLMSAGRQPSLEEVAEEALVSRATAYRYFPSIEPLLVEAALDIDVPDPRELLRDASGGDPAARVERVDAAFDAMIGANEARLRTMLAYSLRQSLEAGQSDVPLRQNRRTPLIEAALAPLRDAVDPETFTLLSRALAFLIGTEGMLVSRDVLQLDADEARQVKSWAIRTLIAGAYSAPSLSSE